MRRFTLASVLAGALWLAGCGSATTHAPEQAHPEQTAQTEKDLVCGMKVDPKTALSSTYQGKKYYFCCQEDKAEFEKDPAKYVKAN